MKKEKLFQVLSGAVLVALGILIAIFQIGALDLYFGIIAIIAGALLLALTCYAILKKKGFNPSTAVLSCVLLALGITLVIHFVSFGALVNLILTLMIGGGAGLILVGAYALIKKDKFGGIIDLVVGVAAITLAVLYIAVEGFRDAFWIIVGVVVAVYGVLEILHAFMEK